MNNQFVGFFTNDIYSDRNNYGFVKLPNPRTETDSVYLWNNEKKILNEIQNFQRDNKSWIVNENIIKESGLYVSNPIDPLFLAIPCLLKHDNHFTSIDIIMQSDEYPQLASIMSRIFESNSKLEQLADLKTLDDCNLYKYNNEKTLTWLKGKVEKLTDYFYQKKIVSDDSTLAVPVSFKDCTETDSDYSKRLLSEAKETAVNIVCDYITVEFEKIFKKYINFEDVILEINSVPVSPIADHKSKSRKSIDDMENDPPIKSPKAVPQKKSKISKETGLKSITSFFSKTNQKN